MYDSLDGKKANILKDVDTTASDSIFVYKPTQTINIKEYKQCNDTNLVRDWQERQQYEISDW